jgi:hypothetical protein
MLRRLKPRWPNCVASSASQVDDNGRPEGWSAKLARPSAIRQHGLRLTKPLPVTRYLSLASSCLSSSARCSGIGSICPTALNSTRRCRAISDSHAVPAKMG